VGELTAPEIVHPYGIDERVVVARNVDGLVPSKRVQCLDVHSEIDSDVLAGYLNSSVHAALLEFWGRNEGGGSLEIMTYELEEIPILNITKLSAQDRGNISTAYENLVRRAEGAQQRLDKAVLSALESSIDPEKLQEMRNAVTQNRVSGAKETAVLVRDLDEFDDLGTRSFERGVDHDRREDAGNSSLEDFH
jgi:hypothetical protein